MKAEIATYTAVDSSAERHLRKTAGANVATRTVQVPVRGLLLPP